MKESTRSAAWSRWLAALTVLSFALVWASAARAQTDPTTVRLTCNTAATSACSTFGSGSAQTLLTTGSSPTLQFTEGSGTQYPGEAFLVVLVPDTSSVSFTVTNTSGATLNMSSAMSWGGSTSNGYNGKLLTTSSGTGFLGVDKGLAGVAGSFSSFTTISDSATSTSVTGYTVYVVDLGSYSSTTNPITFTINGTLPAGAVLWGFVTDSSTTTCTVTTLSGCSAVNSMPYSGTVTVGTSGKPPTVTPEPATLVLLGAGLLLIGLVVRRERFV